MGLKTIEQRILATNDFDGTAPTAPVVRGQDLEQFPAEAAGGLFDFGINNPGMIQSIELVLGGQSVWTIHKRDKDAVEVLLWSGTTETDFVTIDEDAMVITEDQLLVVRTTGATAALKARISVDIEPGNF